jgi:predicted kinase
MSMVKITLTVGCPASGKSFWAKSEIAKDPNNYVRINNDDLRAMLHGSVYSADNEKMITDARNYLLRDALKRGKNVILDNVNANKRIFDEVCKIAKSVNIDVMVMEKPFYAELDELILRDSKRAGIEQVGEAVIQKFWKQLGGKGHKFYSPRTEIYQASKGMDRNIDAMVQNENLPRAVIFDNDGTISLIHSGRSPYDASTCDLDAPHPHVIECMKLYYKAGYKILFLSGREDKDRAPTERFYKQYFPEVEYELYMRPTGDMRRDVIIKEEIFNTHIKDKYFVAGWFDDRLQVSKWVYENGLPLFRVNDPEANF